MVHEETSTPGDGVDEKPQTEQTKQTEQAEAKDIGEKAEIRSLQKRYKNGSAETVSQDEYKPFEFDPNSAYALVVTREYDTHGRLEKTLLNVNSQHLLQVFRDVVHAHPTVPEGFEGAIEIESPYAMLYHSWDELHAHRQTLTEEAELSHLDLLLEFMRLEMGKQRADTIRAAQNGCVTFKNLWAIYKPDELLFTTERDYKCLLKLDKTAYSESQKQGPRFEVHCTRTFNDGDGLCSRGEVFFFYERKLFGGNAAAKIKSLPVHPFALAGQDSSVRDELVERGKQVEELTGIRTMKYSGISEYQKLPPRSFFDPCMEDFDTVWLGFTETGRIVVDPKTYLEDYPQEAKTLSHSWSDEYRSWAEASFGSLERANCALSPPYVHGYSLKKKQWCKFFISNLAPVEWNDSAIDSLIIPETQKSILEALVTSHQFSDNPREFQEQKGKGLVMLLHGTPGSGKTLTAEVAAELSRAPLLPISLGELYWYDLFEEKLLLEMLQYATIWKAVVLIDEADVFLEARTAGKDGSAQRNSLVATFLRSLEYFSGIVFLTSNRVEDFDMAMKSRIHLAIQYSPPATEVRKRIWSSRLAALPEQDRDFKVEEVLERLSRETMNGREISNTINTASTLARFKGVKLALSHLATVIEAWKAFNGSLERLHAKGRTPSFGTVAKSGGVVLDDAAE